MRGVRCARERAAFIDREGLHQAGDTIGNVDLDAYEDFARGGAHTLATLAEDEELRDTLAGGATAGATKARKAKKLSKAKKAALGAYLGKRLIR